jgi:hypothetical protein
MARRHGRAASRGAGERLRSSVLRELGPAPPVATRPRIYVLARARIRTLGALHVVADLGGGCSRRRLYAHSAKLDCHLRAAVSSLILRT